MESLGVWASITQGNCWALLHGSMNVGVTWAWDALNKLPGLFVAHCRKHVL